MSKTSNSLSSTTDGPGESSCSLGPNAASASVMATSPFPTLCSGGLYPLLYLSRYSLPQSEQKPEMNGRWMARKVNEHLA